jgi:hypothetical protein
MPSPSRRLAARPAPQARTKTLRETRRARAALPVFFAMAKDFLQSLALRILDYSQLLVRQFVLLNVQQDFMCRILSSRNALNVLVGKLTFRVRQIFAMTVVRLVGSHIRFSASNALFVQQDSSIPLTMPRRARHVQQDRFAYRAQKNLKNVSQEHILPQIHHHALGARVDIIAHPVKLRPFYVLPERIVQETAQHR